MWKQIVYYNCRELTLIADFALAKIQTQFFKIGDRKERKEEEKNHKEDSFHRESTCGLAPVLLSERDLKGVISAAPPGREKLEGSHPVGPNQVRLGVVPGPPLAYLVPANPILQVRRGQSPVGNPAPMTPD